MKRRTKAGGPSVRLNHHAHLGSDMAYHDQNTIERFLSKVDRRAPDECWPWAASLNADGYGRFKAKGVAQNASRVALEIELDRPLWGEAALHTCDNPICCNPAHLYAGTAVDNQRDRRERERAGGIRETRVIAEHGAAGGNRTPADVGCKPTALPLSYRRQSSLYKGAQRKHNQNRNQFIAVEVYTDLLPPRCKE